MKPRTELDCSGLKPREASKARGAEAKSRSPFVPLETVLRGRTVKEEKMDQNKEELTMRQKGKTR